MNNIEILEDLLQQRYDEKLLNNISMINEKDEVYVLTIFERQAIENLIQENKELKEQNIELLTRLKADGLIERDKYWISKIKEALYNGTLDAKGWGCEDGAYCVEKQFKQLLEEGE